MNIPSALVATAGVLFSNAIANPLVNPIIRPATAKELRYDGRQELDSREKAMSLALTAGTFAVLSVVAWKQNRVDDEVENLRIKDEVERLEKLRAEFVDVEEDEETMDDEDLLASLRERIGEDADGESEGESEEGQEGEGEGGKGTAVMEDDEDGSTTDSVDMLNRMWEATDDDSKKDKKQ